MQESFALFVLILVFFAFNTTRLFGIVMIAYFVYRYPLAALMVSITAALVAHFGMKLARSKQQTKGDRPRRALR